MELRSQLDSDREITKRKERLANWLTDQKFDGAVFLKEDLEFINGNFLYYGGSETSGEYCAIVVDSNGNSYAITHEYSYERVAASGMYEDVYEIRQSIDQLILTLKKVIEDKLENSQRIALDLGYTTVRTFESIQKQKLLISQNSLTEFVYSERAIKSLRNWRDQ